MVNYHDKVHNLYVGFLIQSLVWHISWGPLVRVYVCACVRAGTPVLRCMYVAYVRRDEAGRPRWEISQVSRQTYSVLLPSLQ